jgi:excisionase family DNA binding protein
MKATGLLDEPMLTCIEAAPLLKSSPKTLYRKAQKGEIPCYRLWAGARKTVLRFSRRDLEHWLETRRVLPPGSNPVRRRRR